MYKNIYITIISLLTFMLSSCDKVPVNGDLDGLWQLMEIKKGDNVKDMKAEKLYCSFQLHLFTLDEPSCAQHYFGYFEHEGDTLRFHQFTIRAAYTEDSIEDKLITDDTLNLVTPWGFYSIDCTYDIVTLNSKALVLKHDDTTITYRKF